MKNGVVDTRRNYECPHCVKVLEAKEKEIIKAYELGVRLALTSTQDVKPRPEQNGKAYPGKLFSKICSVCGSADSVSVCLECSFAGCLTHSRKPHGMMTGHYLSVMLDSGGTLYCHACGDFVYNETFEKARVRKLHQFARGGILPKSRVGNGVVGVNPSFQATTGLRGFYNMGATCFMSVILQSFIHNPIVRNFFLSGGHDRTQCTFENCLACCVDQIFADFFNSNNIRGYGIAPVLTASYMLRKTLAGASEQDAHEFFQFILNEFHRCHYHTPAYENMLRDMGCYGEDSSRECDCVTHRSFSGLLESRIRCTACDSTTSTVDPMMDISLEIKSRKQVNNSKVDVHPVTVLETCLDRFTSSEKLDSKYYCNVCQESQIAHKQLFIKQMPVVLSIQLKRFEHFGTSAKIETQVKFPLFIDMAKYTSGDQKVPLIYELFGVVCHQGNLDTGHYTCMMKDRTGVWYHFDDSMVTKTTARQVLMSNAYLLFYIVHKCSP